MPGFDPISLGIGGALSLAGSIGKFFSGVKQVKESRKINPIFNQYQKSPFAGQQLALAQQMFADPTYGMRGQIERGIQTNNANFMGNVSRNAPDSSTLLALGAAGLGQANQDIVNANIGFAGNKAALTQNLNQAYGVNIGEGDKEYQSMLEKYRMDAERKDALRASGAMNKFGSVSDLASMAFTAGTSGGFGNIFGKKSSGVMGGSGMSAVPYGASVYGKLTSPRPIFTTNS